METIERSSSQIWAESLKMTLQRLMNLTLEKYHNEINRSTQEDMMKRSTQYRLLNLHEWMQRLLPKRLRKKWTMSQVEEMSLYEQNRWKLNQQELLLRNLQKLLLWIPTLEGEWEEEKWLKYQEGVKNHMRMGLCLMMLMIIQTKTLSLAKSADEISILTESKNIKQPAKKSQKGNQKYLTWKNKDLKESQKQVMTWDSSKKSSTLKLPKKRKSKCRVTKKQNGLPRAQPSETPWEPPEEQNQSLKPTMARHTLPKKLLRIMGLYNVSTVDGLLMRRLLRGIFLTVRRRRRGSRFEKGFSRSLLREDNYLIRS